MVTYEEEVRVVIPMDSGFATEAAMKPEKARELVLVPVMRKWEVFDVLSSYLGDVKANWLESDMLEPNLVPTTNL